MFNTISILDSCACCGAPPFGMTPQLTIGIPELDGDYCSAECCMTKVLEYFGEKGPARANNCTPENARDIIQALARNLMSSGDVQLSIRTILDGRVIDGDPGRFVDQFLRMKQLELPTEEYVRDILGLRGEALAY